MQRLLFTFLGATVCVAAPNSATALDWQGVLAWIPVDTQTLIVASQPFTIPQSTDEIDSVPAMINSLRTLALGRAYEFPVLQKALAGRSVSFAITGVREFRDFSGLGISPYDGCAVISFTEPLGSALDAALPGIARKREFGVQVAALSQERKGSRRDKPEYDHLYLAQVSPRILVVASDHDSLRLILGRRSHVHSDRALPSTLAEWERVDTSSQVWILRHFRAKDGKNVFLAVGGLEDDEAVGFVYNGGTGSTQTSFYFSRNQRAHEIMGQYWTQKGEGLETPQVTRVSDDVIKVTSHPDSRDAVGTFLLLLLISTGFGILISVRPAAKRRSYLPSGSPLAPGAELPRKSLRPSAKVSVLPTPRLEPSLA